MEEFKPRRRLSRICLKECGGMQSGVFGGQFTKIMAGVQNFPGLFLRSLFDTGRAKMRTWRCVIGHIAVPIIVSCCTHARYPRVTGVIV